MSERAYEDGTPVGGEPRVEGWMRRAGLEISCLDLDGEFHRLMREQELRPEQVPPRLMNLLASIIAKHAPVPQPIRRGDVVQCIRDCIADEGDGMYAVKDVAVTDGLMPISGRLLIHGRWFAPDAFARIGRARYYPDGTPVEN